jgi:hypothetical protein
VERWSHVPNAETAISEVLNGVTRTCHVMERPWLILSFSAVHNVLNLGRIRLACIATPSGQTSTNWRLKKNGASRELRNLSRRPNSSWHSSGKGDESMSGKTTRWIFKQRISVVDLIDPW